LFVKWIKVKPIYWKSIAIGLAGVLIIVALYFFSAYMTYVDLQNYLQKYDTLPRDYDNLIDGARWWVFFFLAVLATLAIVGALSAWASARDTTSSRDTIIASALSGGVPISLATILAMILSAIAVINSPEHYGTHYFTYLFPIILLYLLYAFVGLMLSIGGGLVYRILAKRL
jgi:hypothetical protein